MIGAQDLACEGRVLLLGDLAMNKLGEMVPAAAGRRPAGEVSLLSLNRRQLLLNRI